MLDAAVAGISLRNATASVYVYGSVATGAATPPASDVDLLTIGLESEHADVVAAELSAEFADRCRAVEIAASMPAAFEGDGDEAYGGRVFLHHYCVHLAGADLDHATGGFPGDHRAARGFNGDIARHGLEWRRQLPQAEPSALGRRVSRKVLLAVAGLVSVHDSTWTTDRETAARRWAVLHPELGTSLDLLSAWASGYLVADSSTLAQQLDDAVPTIVRQFAHDIGLWPEMAA